MSRDAVGVVVLCEDRQTECFIRRFLNERKGHWRPIRIETLPKGRGSGEQWVREKFANELKAYRSRSTRAATCLIVAADADHMTVEERIQTFREMCSLAGVAFRSVTERVAFIIPRRNIETWLEYLRGKVVNEDEIYPKYKNESGCHDQVKRLNERCLQGRLSPEPPPSLTFSCDEFKQRVPN